MCNKSDRPTVSYVRLQDCSSAKYEYFRLYNDVDIGFHSAIQDPPESVFFDFFEGFEKKTGKSSPTKKSIDDDCPTEEEQIKISRKDLEKELKEGVAALKEAINSLEETLVNAKHNPKLRSSASSAISK